MRSYETDTFNQGLLGAEVNLSNTQHIEPRNKLCEDFICTRVLPSVPLRPHAFTSRGFDLPSIRLSCPEPGCMTDIHISRGYIDPVTWMRIVAEYDTKVGLELVEIARRPRPGQFAARIKALFDKHQLIRLGLDAEDVAWTYEGIYKRRFGSV